jgi:hypothetical protein
MAMEMAMEMAFVRDDCIIQQAIDFFDWRFLSVLIRFGSVHCISIPFIRGVLID